MVLHYKVAGPAQYLAITEFFTRDLKLAKKAWILPGQKCAVLDVTPTDYALDGEAASAEKLPVLLHTVFTVGSHVDDKASLMRYARKVVIYAHDEVSPRVCALVQGIIKSMIRELATTMVVDLIIKETKSFMQEVFVKAQQVLDPFGLLIYHGNAKQVIVDLQGVPGATNQPKENVEMEMKEGRKKNASWVHANVNANVQAPRREGEEREGFVTTMDMVYDSEHYKDHGGCGSPLSNDRTHLPTDGGHRDCSGLGDHRQGKDYSHGSGADAYNVTTSFQENSYSTSWDPPSTTGGSSWDF